MKKISKFITTVLSLSALSCASYVATTKYGETWPKGSSFKNNNYEYSLTFKMESTQWNTSLAEHTEKKIGVVLFKRRKQEIQDRNTAIFVDETTIKAAALEAEIASITAKKAIIHLFEIGNPLAEDDYNKMLMTLKSRKRLRQIRTYNLDPIKGKTGLLNAVDY